MFTGIVEMTGVIEKRLPDKLFVRPLRPFADPVPGESVAVNGCCLTLEKMENGVLRFHTLAETLSRTNLGSVGLVNLERAMPAGGRFGGHFVSGHIDATTEIVSCRRGPDGDVALVFRMIDGYEKYFVPKGSVAVDGVSLTLAEAGSGCCTVRLIPTTLAETALGERAGRGEKVNIECDLFVKTVVRQMELFQAKTPEKKTGAIDWDLLEKKGFV